MNVDGPTSTGLMEAVQQIKATTIPTLAQLPMEASQPTILCAGEMKTQIEGENNLSLDVKSEERLAAAIDTDADKKHKISVGGLDITTDSIDQADPLLNLICDKFQIKQPTLEHPREEGVREASIEVDEQGWSMESVSPSSSAMGGNIDPNSTTSNGGTMTNREEVLGWSLPSINSSLLLERSMTEFQKSLGLEGKNGEKDSKEENRPLTHSTPVIMSYKKED